MSAFQMNWHKRLSALLLVCAAALVGLLADEVQQGIALRDGVFALKNRPSATPSALKLEPPFQLQTLSSYSPIVEQPLFVSSRQPAKAETTVAAAPPEQFELTGIAQSAQESVVLLRNAKTGKTERLKTGEKTKDGLVLDSAEANRATIDQNGQKVALDLEVALSGNRRAGTAQPPHPEPPASASSKPNQAAIKPPAVAKPVGGPPAVDPGLDQLNLQRAKKGLAPCHSDGSCPR